MRGVHQARTPRWISCRVVVEPNSASFGQVLTSSAMPQGLPDAELKPGGHRANHRRLHVATGDTTSGHAAGDKVLKAIVQEQMRRAVLAFVPGRYTVALLDLRMPDADGFELIYKLKHDLRFSHIPIVVLTVRDGHPDAEMRAMALGAVPKKLGQHLERWHTAAPERTRARRKRCTGAAASSPPRRRVTRIPIRSARGMPMYTVMSGMPVEW